MNIEITMLKNVFLKVYATYFWRTLQKNSWSSKKWVVIGTLLALDIGVNL